MMDPLLEVRNLFKGYRFGQTDIAVLQGISMCVSPAEMVVIMGPSGSGKTTLLNCISGIDNPDSGEVVLSGSSVNFDSETEKTLMRRKRIGMVFQFFNLIPTLTVWDNVALPFLISRIPENSFHSRVREMIAKVGLESRVDHYPSQLSGGEMQLVSIARALVHSPVLLLADEPTGNVNHKVGRAIMDILRRTAKDQGTGIAMVTHSPEHAAWADRVCFLKDGVIVKEHVQHGNRDAVSVIYEHLVQLGI